MALTEDALRNSVSPLMKAKFLINRGNVYYEQKKAQLAEASYREAIQVYPNSIIARANLSSLMAATGRLVEAEKLLLEVLQINPNNTVMRANLAKIQAQLQKSRQP